MLMQKLNTSRLILVTHLHKKQGEMTCISPCTDNNVAPGRPGRGICVDHTFRRPPIRHKKIRVSARRRRSHAAHAAQRQKLTMLTLMIIFYTMSRRFSRPPAPGYSSRTGLPKLPGTLNYLLRLTTRYNQTAGPPAPYTSLTETFSMSSDSTSFSMCSLSLT